MKRHDPCVLGSRPVSMLIGRTCGGITRERKEIGQRPRKALNNECTPVVDKNAALVSTYILALCPLS